MNRLMQSLLFNQLQYQAIKGAILKIILCESELQLPVL